MSPAPTAAVPTTTASGVRRARAELLEEGAALVGVACSVSVAPDAAGEAGEPAAQTAGSNGGVCVGISALSA
jgi:hypothetical protein